MQTAGRMVILATILAMVMGWSVLFYRNGYRLNGMFQSYWSSTLKTNAKYYPHVQVEIDGVRQTPIEEEQSWSTEGY